MGQERRCVPKSLGIKYQRVRFVGGIQDEVVGLNASHER